MIDSAGLYAESLGALLASSPLHSDSAPSKGGELDLEVLEETGSAKPNKLNLDSSDESVKPSSDEYVLFQRRIFLVHMALTVFAVAISSIFFDFYFSISFLLGSLAGILYLRLLAKSIGKLGKESNAVGKFQLLIPVLVVLMVSKTPQLQLIPTLVGFLFYKLSLITQVMLES